jgi:hypothetical protein
VSRYANKDLWTFAPFIGSLFNLVGVSSDVAEPLCGEGIPMNHSRLRVYHGPEENTQSTIVADSSNSPYRVTIPAGEVFAALGDAVRNNRVWLKDFAEDDITIPTDLYEVILAYEHYRRPSA